MNDLPFTDELKNGIIKLDEFYQNLLNLDDPFESGFNNEIDAAEFAKKTLDLAEKMKRELDGIYEFVFNKIPWEIMVSKIKNLNKRKWVYWSGNKR